MDSIETSTSEEILDLLNINWDEEIDVCKNNIEKKQ